MCNINTDNRRTDGMKMSTSLLLFLIAFALTVVPARSQVQLNNSIPFIYASKIIEDSGATCPPARERETLRTQISNEIRPLLQTAILNNQSFVCGNTSGWTRVAYVDMSNNSQQCPGDLREVNRSGIRLCDRDSRADTSQGICTSVIFPTNGIVYNEVCGRVIGYSMGSTSAFYDYTFVLGADNTIDEYYVDGVTLTHGRVGAREHIWTFVAGLEEDFDNSHAQFVCPCAPNAAPSIMVPPFIGANYFCESGSLTFTNSFNNEPLWDGNGCSVGNTCCTFNNPPYFTRRLPASTSDDIELRNCGYYSVVSHRTSTFIRLIELYVK